MDTIFVRCVTGCGSSSMSSLLNEILRASRPSLFSGRTFVYYMSMRATTRILNRDSRIHWFGWPAKRPCVNGCKRTRGCFTSSDRSTCGSFRFIAVAAETASQPYFQRSQYAHTTHCWLDTGAEMAAPTDQLSQCRATHMRMRLSHNFNKYRNEKLYVGVI